MRKKLHKIYIIKNLPMVIFWGPREGNMLEIIIKNIMFDDQFPFYLKTNIHVA